MCKKVIFAGIVGGIVYFIWSSVSWMVLTWHQDTIMHFKNETQVVQVLQNNTDESGVYLLPGYPKDFKSLESDAKEKAQTEINNRFNSGPLVYLGYSKEGQDPGMKREIGMWFLTQLIGAFLIASLLWCVKDRSYFCRLFFVATVGVTVGFLGNMPHYVWWHQGLNFTVINILDDIIGWTLAGIFMAAIVTPKKRSGAPS